jgi:hypothetical protein
MTKPILQVIEGGPSAHDAEDAAFASVPFDALLDMAVAPQLRRGLKDAFAAAEQVTAAVAILAGSKADLVSMIGAAGSQQAAEAHGAEAGLGRCWHVARHSAGCRGPFR